MRAIVRFENVGRHGNNREKHPLMSLELAGLLLGLAGALWAAISKRIDRVEGRFDQRLRDVEQQLNQGRLFGADRRLLAKAGQEDRLQRYSQEEEYAE